MAVFVLYKFVPVKSHHQCQDANKSKTAMEMEDMKHKDKIAKF